MSFATDRIGFTPAPGGAQDPDHLYYNMTIINSDITDGTDPNVVFTETRESPLLQNPMEYNFSIVRFDMNGPNKDLPLFMPRIEVGQSNPNLTVYQITLRVAYSYVWGGTPYTGTLTSTPASGKIIWTPEITDPVLAPVPPPPTTVQDVQSRYYWATTYSHWLQCVNDAYQSAWNNLNTQFLAVVGNPGVSLTTKPPFMTYNPTDNLFTIYADRYGFGDNGTASANRTSAGTTADENFSLFFNTNLNGLFTNFKNLFVNQPNGLAYQIMIQNIKWQNILQVNSPPAPLSQAASYWILNQDYESTSSLWSPVDSIVFTTSLIPLVFEQSAEPVVFGASNTGSVSGVQANFTPIITDTSLALTSASGYREFFQYAPTAEYRLSNFVRSSSPLQQVQVSVFWKNRLNGQLYPLQMYNSSSVSIKMLFRRRGIYTYPHLATAGYRV